MEFYFQFHVVSFKTIFGFFKGWAIFDDLWRWATARSSQNHGEICLTNVSKHTASHNGCGLSTDFRRRNSHKCAWSIEGKYCENFYFFRSKLDSRRKIYWFAAKFIVFEEFVTGEKIILANVFIFCNCAVELQKKLLCKLVLDMCKFLLCNFTLDRRGSATWI